VNILNRREPHETPVTGMDESRSVGKHVPTVFNDRDRKRASVVPNDVFYLANKPQNGTK